MTRSYALPGLCLPMWQKDTFVWSVENLINTALGQLQSKTLDSRDSVEQIQEQMEKKIKLYDNICDEEEKQSIKMKNKSQKNDKS